MQENWSHMLNLAKWYDSEHWVRVNMPLDSQSVLWLTEIQPYFLLLALETIQDNGEFELNKT